MLPRRLQCLLLRHRLRREDLSTHRVRPGPSRPERHQTQMCPELLPGRWRGVSASRLPETAAHQGHRLPRSRREVLCCRRIDVRSISSVAAPFRGGPGIPARPEPVLAGHFACCARPLFRKLVPPRHPRHRISRNRSRRDRFLPRRTLRVRATLCLCPQARLPGPQACRESRAVVCFDPTSTLLRFCLARQPDWRRPGSDFRGRRTHCHNHHSARARLPVSELRR